MERSGFRVAGSRGNSSPERGRATGREVAYAVAQPPAPPMRRVMKVLKKVQVVYYLTRNGQLEHPHFMEVSHLANQQLRLKDFIDRLILLRGRGMPSRYSWSCKRSYKNGYVWNDLTENDIIHTSEGAEYILKGSEILLHSSSEFSNKTPVAFMAETERLQQLQISEKRAQTIYNPIPKLKMNTSLINGDLDLPKTPTKVEEEGYPEETEDSVLNHKDDEEVVKRSFTSSNVPSCHCSRRTVSTEELQFVNGSTRKSSSELQNHSILLADDHPSPQSTTSTLSSEKGEMGNNKSREPSRRFVVVEEEQEEDSTVEMMNQGKSSVLLQLIACGGSVAAKGKSIPCLKQQMSRAEGRVVVNGGGGGGGLHRGVVCKAAVAAAGKVVVMGEEEVMIKYMSENPRFGNLQSEEKEYFSGSILEAMDDQRRAQVKPVLKKSSSYKEERSCKTGLGEVSEETGEEDHKVEKKAASSACGGKSICIPNPMRKHNKQQSKK